MVYKILYLPTAEYIMIYKPIIDVKIIAKKYNFSTLALCTPRSLLDSDSPAAKSDRNFQIALFKTKKLAILWLSELIARKPSQKLRKEHFEIIKIEQSLK